MNPAAKTFRKQFLVICAGGALVLLALALAQAKGLVSAQVFTVLAIMWWTAMIAFLLPAIRRFNREMAAYKKARMAQGLPAESREELAQRIRSLKRYILIAVILFPLLLWANSDQTRSSELVGAAVWLFLIAAMVRSLRRKQKEFKAL
jgi:hypothetical protein